MINVNALPLEGEGGLIDLLQTLVDPRKPRGVRHPVVTIVGIAVCAALSGARSFCAIGEWAQGLTREALERLEYLHILCSVFGAKKGALAIGGGNCVKGGFSRLQQCLFRARSVAA